MGRRAWPRNRPVPAVAVCAGGLAASPEAAGDGLGGATSARALEATPSANSSSKALPARRPQLAPRIGSIGTRSTGGGQAELVEGLARLVAHRGVVVLQRTLERRARGVPPEPSQRPGGVPTHERARVAGERPAERRDGLGIAGVAQRDGGVAGQPDAAHPSESAALDQPAMRGGALLEQLDQIRGFERRPSGELWSSRWNRGRGVEGTHVLADVAAEDVRCRRAPQLARDGAGQLDGEVRDAAACIEHARVDERAGRARVEAGGTGPAAWAFGSARRDVEIDQQLAEQDVLPTPGTISRVFSQ